MRRIIVVLVWSAIFGSLAYFSLVQHEYVNLLETRASGKVETGAVSRIWFSPGGELVGTRQDGAELTVRAFTLPAGAIARERKVLIGSVDPHMFAVAEDASRVASISGAGVRIEDLSKPASAAVDRALPRKVPASAIAFSGAGALAVLYADGELQLWDPAAGSVRVAAHLDLKDPAPLLASGHYLAAYSPSSGDAVVYDTGAGDKLSLVESKKYPPDILSATLSSQARFAVGTKERVEQQGYSINAPGPVRSLAFFDRSRILVAGDFPGIYLLGADRGPHQVAVTDPGASVVAANDVSMASSGGNSVNLFSFKLVPTRVYLGMKRPSPLLLLVLLGVGSPLVVYFFYATLSMAMKKAKKPVQAETAAREKEGPIPNALIEACLNGDCVLYAGSGLGAQAGLPTWSALLPEVSARVGEPGLPDYLRSRFHGTAQLSEAHHLIKEIDFATLVTTSLDNLLERAFPYSGGRVYTARDCAALGRLGNRRDFFILKPYGVLDEPETLCIGPAQGAAAMRENPTMGELIEDLFHSRVFLFLGASLEGVESDLARLTLDEPAGRRHFALVADTGEAWKEPAERLKQRYGIEALTYTPSTEKHPELVEFLTKLMAAIREKTSAQEFYAAGDA